MSSPKLVIMLAIAMMAIGTEYLILSQPVAIETHKAASSERNRQKKLSQTPAETIQVPVTFTAAAPLRQFYNGRSASFETLSFIEEWSLLETRDVVLINSSIAGAQLCPEALADFMASFTPKQFGSTLHASYGMPIKTLRDITTRMRGKTAPVSVRIPSFEAPPTGLEKCTDFGWAENTHRLTYRGKPVAVMMAEQPQLAH